MVTTTEPAPTGKKPRKPIPWWSGAIFACGVGVMLMPFVDPMLPRRSEPGRITDTHIEKHRRTTNGRSRTVTSYITEGRTDDGESWDITDHDLYDDATTGDEVVVEFSRLSGNAVSVDGPGYRYDAAAGWARYVFLAGAAFFGVMTVLVRPKGRVRRLTWAVANLAAFALGGVIGLAIV